VPDLHGGEDRAQQGRGLVQPLVIISAARVNGVLGREVGAKPVDVGDRGPVQTHGGGKILPGQARALAGFSRMPEVGVPVEMDQPVATRCAPQRKTRRHQDAAISAE
jgi:hypothetical protein